jgi:carbon storage regulator CsrA
MLVLSRKNGQVVKIYTPEGEIITVKVNQIDTTRVSLAFDASLRVKIVREEVEHDQK